MLLKKSAGAYDFQRGEAMDLMDKPEANKDAVEAVVVEIKLHVNNRLYQQGAITEEMYTRAKEAILKEAGLVIGTYRHLKL